MKKLFLVLVALLFTFGLTSCDLFGNEPLEFSGSGITITLDDSFQETDTMYVSFYLESFDYIFTGEREDKTLFSNTGIDNLEDYINAVLEYADNEDEEVILSEDETFYYAYYTASVDEDEFGYMLICMESDDYYYVMNFGCYENKLDDSKEQFFEWVDTIVIE